MIRHYPRSGGSEQAFFTESISYGKGNHLPTFGAEADVPLDELPENHMFAFQQRGLSCELLADQSRGPAVADDTGQPEAKFSPDGRRIPSAGGLVPFVDPQEAVAQHQDGRVRSST